MSPGKSSFAADRREICSATLQIILDKSLDCLTSPLTASVMLPLFICRSRGMQMADHGRMVEGFADLPRLLASGHLVLQVAPGHVQADGVAEHAGQCLVHRQIAPALVQCGDQLDLMVIVP